MKISCEKALLQSAVSAAIRAVDEKSRTEVLSGVLISTASDYISVTGYDLEMGIQSIASAVVMEEGSCVFKAKLLLDIIKKMPDQHVDITTDGTTAKIQSGDVHYTIQTIASSDFPDLPDVEPENSFSMEQGKLKSMIADTIFAVSSNEVRPVHTGSLFEVSGGEVTTVALDGFRMALRREKLDGDSGDFSFIVPASALGEVQRICGDTDEPVDVAQGPSHIKFTVDNIALICRRLEGQFLAYRSAIPKNDKAVKVEKRALLDSVGRVSVLLDAAKRSPLRLHFDKDEVSISINTSIGQASDVCPLDGDCGELEIGFDDRYLSDALRHAPQSTLCLELGGPTTACVIKPEDDGDDSFLYLVLPVRLRADG